MGCFDGGEEKLRSDWSSDLQSKWPDQAPIDGLAAHLEVLDGEEDAGQRKASNG